MVARQRNLNPTRVQRAGSGEPAKRAELAAEESVSSSYRPPAGSPGPTHYHHD